MGFFTLFALTSSGGFDSGDAVGRYETAKSWVEGRGGALPLYGEFNSAVIARNGERFTCYSLLQPLLMTPGLIVTRALQLSESATKRWNRISFNLILIPFLSALALLLVYLSLQRMGYSQTSSMFAALTAGVATPLWHYSRSAQEENLVVLGFALWLFGMAGFLKEKPWSLVMAAFGGSVALAARWAAVFPLISLMALSIALLYRHRDRLREKETRRDLAAAFALCSGVVLTLLAYNQYRFDSPWETGYGLLYEKTGLFSLEGMGAKAAALLFSPYRGLFFYCPVLVLLLAPKAFPRRKALLEWAGPLALLGAFALNVSYLYWSGGFSWGPRFLVAPLILIAPLFAKLYTEISSTGAPGMIGRLVLCVSIAVQLASVMLPSSLEDTIREHAGVEQDSTASAWVCEHTALCIRPPYLAHALSNTLVGQKSINTEFETQSESSQLQNPDFQTIFWWPFRFSMRFARFPWGLGLALAFALATASALLFAKALAPFSRHYTDTTV